MSMQLLNALTKGLKMDTKSTQTIADMVQSGKIGASTVMLAHKFDRDAIAFRAQVTGHNFGVSYHDDFLILTYYGSIENVGKKQPLCDRIRSLEMFESCVFRGDYKERALALGAINNMSEGPFEIKVDPRERTITITRTDDPKPTYKKQTRIPIKDMQEGDERTILLAPTVTMAAIRQMIKGINDRQEFFFSVLRSNTTRCVVVREL